MARTGHSATLLNDGTVLIAGGQDEETQTLTNKVELYDPASGEFIPLQNGLKKPRARHTATLLEDGSVLITGGVTSFAEGIFENTDSAEIYDSSTKTFSLISSKLATPMSDHAALKLANGDVFIIGRNKLGETVKVRNGGSVFLESNGSLLNQLMAQVFLANSKQFGPGVPVTIEKASIDFSNILVSLQYDTNENGGRATVIKSPSSDSTITFDGTILDPKLTLAGDQILITIEGLYGIFDTSYPGNLPDLVADGLICFPNSVVLTDHSSVFSGQDQAILVGTQLLADKKLIDTNNYYKPSGSGYITVNSNVTQFIDVSAMEADLAAKSFGDLQILPQPRPSHEVVRLVDGRYLYSGGYGSDGIEEFSVNINYPARTSHKSCKTKCDNCGKCVQYADGQCGYPSGLIQCGMVCGSCSTSYTYYQPTVGFLEATFIHDSGATLTSAELLDPKVVTFKALEDQMNIGRVGHTMTLLKDGTVLVVGQNKEAEVFNYIR